MEALSQAYSGIQQYAAAAALPNLYNQSLLSQQSISAAGSQKEGQICALLSVVFSLVPTCSHSHRSVFVNKLQCVHVVNAGYFSCAVEYSFW